MEQFCETYNLKSLIRQPKIFKNIDNPSCIDLILTYHRKCFQVSGTFETELSDFYELILTVSYLQKQKPRIIKYRNYINFNNHDFRADLFKW